MRCTYDGNVKVRTQVRTSDECEDCAAVMSDPIGAGAGQHRQGSLGRDIRTVNDGWLISSRASNDIKAVLLTSTGVPSSMWGAGIFADAP